MPGCTSMPKAYDETQEGDQFVSNEHRIKSFQASLRNTSECSSYRKEKNIENDRL